MPDVADSLFLQTDCAVPSLKTPPGVNKKIININRNY